MKVLIIDTVDPILTEGMHSLGFELEEDYHSSKAEIMAKLPDYEGMVIRSRFPVNKEFIECGTSLKFIARVGAGMENIDIPFAESKGINLIKAQKLLKDRKAAFENDKVDWAICELLAYGSLLLEGNMVRRK